MKKRREVVFCDCSYPAHNLVLEIYEDEETKETELILFYRLANYLNFWKRLRAAYKYVFQKDVDRIDYIDMVLSNREELQKLKDIVDEVYNSKIGV